MPMVSGPISPATATASSRNAQPAADRLVAVAASEPWPILKIVPRPADPDDVVRRAIAAHEMRQR